MNLKSLENKKVKAIFKDENINLSVKYKTKLRNLADEIYTKEELEKIYGFKINNEVKSFDEKLVKDSFIKKITLEDEDGYRIYSRTVKFVLKMALKNLYSDLQVDISNTIDNNIYFIVKNKEFTGDMAVEILREMRRIETEKYIIERRVVHYNELVSLYAAQKNKNKLENITSRINAYSSIYFCDNFCDTMYGVLAKDTSYATDFDIKVFRKGFILILSKSCKVIVDKKPKENKLYSLYEENDNFLDNIGVYSVDDLNKEIISSNISSLINISEAYQSNKMSELLSLLKNKSSLKVILIAGPSSSGKTTFAHKLSTNLRLIYKRPVTISMDNYFKERKDTPLQKNGEYDFETIEALDLALFNSDIEKLLNGKEIKEPSFNFITGEKEYNGNTMKLKENDVLVIEGIHALNPRILDKIQDESKFKIYLAPMTSLNIDDFSKVSTTDTRMIRRIVRDNKTRGHSVEKTLKMWSNITKGEVENIYPYINRADYIFNTSLVYELGVLKTFAEPLLLQVKSNSEYFSESMRLYNFLKNFLSISITEVPTDSILKEFIGEE